jgi:Asp-tRNA(Asn)/Glu-tRNA(Gln) amidotransferase C subunit
MMSTKKRTTSWVWVAAGLAVAASVGCTTAYYSAWEMLGQEKRDLLRSNVSAVQEEQQEAADQFESALDRLRELTAVDAGELEDVYDDLNGDYEEAKLRADGVHERIEKIDSIANDLFVEWEAEIGEISSADMRTKSRKKLDETKRNYAGLESKLRKSEASMEPVLTQLQDNVLFLKHNLNAAAIGGLSAEVAGIESDIETLIADMRASIAEADRFLQTLPE